VCPARPARKNRKIEENKRAAGAARRASRWEGGTLGRQRRRWGRGRRGDGGGGGKKEKGTAGPAARRGGSSARARVRVYPARAAAENYFSTASAEHPPGIRIGYANIECAFLSPTDDID